MQKWYSYEKYTYDRKEGWDILTLPDGRLFSKGIWPTNLTAKDLPESFIYGRFYKKWGYMDTAGIKDMFYEPNKTFNHFLKDDRLVISYTGKIKKKKDKNYDYLDLYYYENEDFSVWGNEIIDFLKGAKEYSGIDIKPFIAQIKDKLKWLKETYKEEFGDFNPGLDEVFAKPIRNLDPHLKKKEPLLDI